MLTGHSCTQSREPYSWSTWAACRHTVDPLISEPGHWRTEMIGQHRGTLTRDFLERHVEHAREILRRLLRSGSESPSASVARRGGIVRSEEVWGNVWAEISTEEGPGKER